MYNNAFRIVMGLSRRCSASETFVHNRVNSFGEFIRKEIYSFWNRVLNSINPIVQHLTNTFFGSMTLYTYSRWVRLLYSGNYSQSAASWSTNKDQLIIHIRWSPGLDIILVLYTVYVHTILYILSCLWIWFCDVYYVCIYFNMDPWGLK